MRCVACNNILEDSTLYLINKHTGLPEDLCKECRNAVFNEYSFISDHEYEHREVTEALNLSE